VGILEKTRALLVSKLGPRIKDSSADARALRDLVLELERARTDVMRGIEALEHEIQWLENEMRSPDEDKRLAKIRADVDEGRQELVRVVEGIVEAKAALAMASKPRGTGRP
jgi:chromosome segregation ATPase